MTPDQITTLGQTIGFLVIGGYAAWKAHRSDRQTRATGNGFADFVKAELASISRRVDEQGARLVRMEDRLDRTIDRRGR
jgi:hypothetical protein